jgi:cycloeucalenol cycloisomerase
MKKTQSKNIAHRKDEPQWLSAREAKRHTEKVFLVLSVAWISVFGLVVVTQVYKQFTDFEYMALALSISLPFLFVPLLFPSPAEKNTPITERYFFKANVWIWLFGFVGNYFWTHYFYKVLGASYSFPVTIMLNDVPFFLYLITHAYFCSYHTVSTILLRRFWTSSLYPSNSRVLRFIVSSLLIFVMSVITAFMETYTISEVPYYAHTNKFLMYTVGSVFYAIYFCVSFPMFYRLDEEAGDKWDLARATIDSLAAGMTVTIFLDFWRLLLPSIEGSALAWNGIPYFD